MLRLMTPNVSGSSAAAGNSRWVTGPSSLAIHRVIPACFATSMSPLQKQREPVRAMTRDTALPPSSRAAAFTASIRPLPAPNTTASSAIPAISTFIPSRPFWYILSPGTAP